MVDAMAAGGLDPAVTRLEAQTFKRIREWLSQERIRAEAGREQKRQER